MADANFGIDFDDAVNLFARVTVAFKADCGFEQSDFDLRRWSFLGLDGFLTFLQRSSKENCEEWEPWHGKTGHARIVTGLKDRSRERPDDYVTQRTQRTKCRGPRARSASAILLLIWATAVP